VKFAKLAAGVLPREVGIAVGTGLKNGQSIPIPSGFTKEECVFFATFKLIVIPAPGTSVHCLAQTDGMIAASPEDAIVVTGVAIAKKGGW
jgi:hypothetical protein